MVEKLHPVIVYDPLNYGLFNDNSQQKPVKPTPKPGIFINFDTLLHQEIIWIKH